MPDTDIAVIGAGTAGTAVATLAAALGLRVTLFERDRMGGRRLHGGGLAGQALLRCAQAAQAIRDGGRFGVRAADLAVDWDAVRAHLRAVAEAVAPEVSEARFAGMGVEVVRAAAYFAGPRSLQAGGRSWRFRRCVIAAGSEPLVPADLMGLGEVSALTPDTLLQLEQPPGHLLMLGSGPEALELAQAHARLGCLVTVVAAERFAPAEDPDLALGLRDALERDGITVLEGQPAVRVARQELGLELLLADGRRVTGTHLVLALGRVPRLAPLDLPVGGVRFSVLGVETNAALRSPSNRRVWAAGSAANPAGAGPQHPGATAAEHAGLLLRSLLFQLPARLSARPLPRTTFTAPALLQVGLTAEAAAAAGHEVRTQRFPLSATDRAAADGLEGGLVKLVADSRGRLLGAGVLAPDAAEMAGLLQRLVAQRSRLSALAALALPSPTLAEGTKRAAAEFYAPLVTGPWARKLARLARLLP
ncbi:FAD-dependent oxidoreductase [Roseomonas sp. BN140053]|uniref:FAD-dependent oxidoreductase n=1 Tax=Roseomonas sp. BN140053 TaxID=3391898 RepID=UPI0039ECFFB0